MKDTLNSLHFPIPIVVIPKENNHEAISENYVQYTTTPTEIKDHNKFLYGHDYIVGETVHTLPGEIPMMKFTLVFWFTGSNGNVVEIKANIMMIKFSFSEGQYRYVVCSISL